MSPSEWICTILQRHGIEKPDGRPLYQYRLNEKEFDELDSLLRLSTHLGINNIFKMLFWDAAFVMYVAEWWRRYYKGVWGWEGVFDSIGINYKELGVAHRNMLIESGLQRWRRDVRSVDGARKFLGTVATEGGLPLNQLKGSGGWLRNVLQPTLKKHLSRGIDITVLIDSYEDLIPSSYRSVELAQILTDIAYTVIKLRQDYDLKEKEEPLDWLDENQPNWREWFPLPMDDSQARSLLSDLIDTVSRTRVDDSAKAPFEVERVLVRAETVSADLVSHVHIPTFVFLAAIGFDASRNDIPSLIDLEVYEPGGESWPWCRAVVTTYRGRNALKLSGKSLRLTGEQATKELRLRFKHVGERLLDIPIMGGENLDSNLPWLFREVDGKWVLYGTASQSIKSKEAIVYIPASYGFSGQDSDAEFSRCGELLGGVLVKLSGVMHCQGVNTKYRLSAGHEDSNIRYELRGKKCLFPSTPKDIYIGQPELIEVNIISGSISHRHGSKLIAKKIGVNDDWQLLSQVGPGYYELRLIDDDGNIQLRKRVGILDENFSVEIKPDHNQVKSGVICINGATDMELAINDELLGVTITSDGERRDIQVVAKKEPTISVNVSLLPRGQKKIISMVMPYPSMGALLFDEKGLPVPLTRPLNLNNLRGFRLKLFDNKFHQGKKINLSFFLIDSAMDGSGVRDIYIEKKVTLSGAMNEFSIYDWYQYIDTLIRVGTSVDSMVKININIDAREIFRLLVRRYENELITIGDAAVGFDLQALKEISVSQLAGMGLSIINLGQPEQNVEDLTPQSSQGLLTGSWDFNPETRKDGSWLIYPSPDSTVSFRPKLWNIGRDDEVIDVHTLTKAMLATDPVARAIHIKAVMREMAAETDHRSWSHLENLWQKTKHLSVTTFDIWRLSASEPSFIACLFVHDKNGIVAWLQAELLVIWELVSVENWTSSLNQYRLTISRKLNDKNLVDELLSRKVESIEKLNPSLVSIGKILRERLLGEPCQELATLKAMPANVFLEPQLKEEYQNLLRRQADSDWPELLSKFIDYQLKNLPAVYTALVSTNHNHQSAVTFLPWLVAWRALSKEAADWPNTPAEVFKIQQLIDFDKDWFCAAFQLLSGWLSQQDMESL